MIGDDTCDFSDCSDPAEHIDLLLPTEDGELERLAGYVCVRHYRALAASLRKRGYEIDIVPFGKTDAGKWEEQ